MGAITRIIARKVLQITVSKGFSYNRPSLWLRFVKTISLHDSWSFQR